MHGNFIDDPEVGAIILDEIGVGEQGLNVLVVSGSQFENVVFLDGFLAHGG